MTGCIRRGCARAVLLVVVCLVAFAGRGEACLWDDDTLAEAAEGLPDVAQVIVGHYEVYPPEYYEARLERVKRELEEDPEALHNYDNAAVACDRLGRYGEAIEWMAAKQEAMQHGEHSAEEIEEHQYRYLANLGTFHAHRWVANGMQRDDTGDLLLGRDLIAEAIEVNPDAHFGRERYQLFALEWLIDPPGSPEEAFRPSTVLDHVAPVQERLVRMGRGRRGTLDEWELADAMEGISGLIVLGAGQESVDLMYTLSALLAIEGAPSLAYLASLRTQEILDSGGRSLHPLAEEFTAPNYVTGKNLLRDPVQEHVEKYFVEAREQAKEWRANRNRHLLEMLAQGQHPDTHPDVWAQAPRTPEFLPLPGRLPLSGNERFIYLLIGFGVLCVLYYFSQFIWRRK